MIHISSPWYLGFVHTKLAGKWRFTTPKLIFIGFGTSHLMFDFDLGLAKLLVFRIPWICTESGKVNLVWGRRCGFQPSLAISCLFGWGTPWHPHLEVACRFCHNCHGEWLESPHFQVRIPIMSVFQVSRYCSTWYQEITCWGNGRRLQIYLDIETEWDWEFFSAGPQILGWNQGILQFYGLN